MRTYRECYKYLQKHLIAELNPDIFIHTWENQGGTWKKDEGTEKTISESELHDLYSPEEAVIENFTPGSYFNLDGVTVPHKVESLGNYQKGILPMFYKMYSVNELKYQRESMNGFKYDVVILLRPDFLVLQPIPDKVLGNPESLWVRPRPEFKLDDQLVISKSEHIDYYTSIWNELMTYWETELGDEYGPMGVPNNHDEYSHNTNIGVPERLVHYHIERSDIEVNNFNLNGRFIRHGEDADFIAANQLNRTLQILFGDDEGIKKDCNLPEMVLLFLRHHGPVELAKRAIEYTKK